MPWSSGTFSRFYGATGWTDDKNASIKILSSRHDTHDQDLADGINACITRDNQAKPTANFLPATDNTLGLGSLAFRWTSINGITWASGVAKYADTTANFTGTLQYGGNEVGFRGLPGRTFATSSNTAASDNGSVVIFTGAGGQTFTGDTDLVSAGVCQIWNIGSASLTVAVSGTLSWLNGGGSIPTGSRTLAIGGVVTIYHNGSGNYFVYGTGLS